MQFFRKKSVITLNKEFGSKFQVGSQILQKAEGRIGRKVVSIKENINTIVWIF